MGFNSGFKGLNCEAVELCFPGLTFGAGEGEISLNTQNFPSLWFLFSDYPQRCYKPGVSNPWTVRLCYAARGHI